MNVEADNLDKKLGHLFSVNIFRNRGGRLTSELVSLNINTGGFNDQHEGCLTPLPLGRWWY